MPPAIQPPACLPTDEETTPVNIDKLSDSDLGALIRQELEGTGARFVKTFYAKVGGRWALHHTLVSKP